MKGRRLYRLVSLVRMVDLEKGVARKGAIAWVIREFDAGSPAAKMLLGDALLAEYLEEDAGRLLATDAGRTFVEDFLPREAEVLPAAPGDLRPAP